MKQGLSFAKKQGTVIALACAAALAALPQVANAASDGLYDTIRTDGHPLTLQGNISIGYARNYTNGGRGPATDGAERGNVWSGESNIRFSASTKLGGSFVQAYGFQVEQGFETSDGTVSGSQGTLASRNSALGFSMPFGTVWAGKWDTPFKQNMGIFYLTASSNGLGASTTGFIGTPGLGTGSFSGTAGGTLGNPAPGTTAGAATLNFRRRQANTLNWISPDWGGFQIVAQYGPDEELGAAPATQAGKAQLWSVAGGYSAGPLNISIAYEQHNDYIWGNYLNVGTGTKLGFGSGIGTTSDDHAIGIGVNYQFGPVLLSGYWEKLDYSQSGGTTVLSDFDIDKFYVGARWAIGGPHSLTVAYGKAGELSCGGALTAAQRAGCDDTGASMMNFLYRYRLDKVTYFNVFYGVLSNDHKGNFVASNSVVGGLGHQDRGWSVGMQSSF